MHLSLFSYFSLSLFLSPSFSPSSYVFLCVRFSLSLSFTHIPSLALSVFLSLSLSHTHTRTHTHAQHKYSYTNMRTRTGITSRREHSSAAATRGSKGIAASFCGK